MSAAKFEKNLAALERRRTKRTDWGPYALGPILVGPDLSFQDPTISAAPSFPNFSEALVQS